MTQFIKNYKIAWIAISVLLIFGSALTMACGFSGSFAISVLISGVIAPVIFVTSGLAAIYFYILLKETEEQETDKIENLSVIYYKNQCKEFNKSNYSEIKENTGTKLTIINQGGMINSLKKTHKQTVSEEQETNKIENLSMIYYKNQRKEFNKSERFSYSAIFIIPTPTRETESSTVIVKSVNPSGANVGIMKIAKKANEALIQEKEQAIAELKKANEKIAKLENDCKQAIQEQQTKIAELKQEHGSEVIRFTGTHKPEIEQNKLNSLQKILLSGAKKVPNDRDGGHKYRHALKVLYDALQSFSSEEHSFENQTFSLALKDIIQYFETNPLISLRGDVRDVNKSVIKNLRLIIESDSYKKNTCENNLVRALCLAKFTKVYPYKTFKDLVDHAAGSNQLMQSMDSSYSSDLSKDNIWKRINYTNELLSKASGNYVKDKVSLNKGKLQGEFGFEFDPGGTSNVPYVRSEFRLDDKTITFCRFGTPTVQSVIANNDTCSYFSKISDNVSVLGKGIKGVFGGCEATVDPMFLGALDAMQEKNEQFLYVNHQKLNGKEAKRVDAIRSIEHKNFHFMSIPLDGKVTEAIKDNSISELKDSVINSFMNGENGCVLPKDGMKETLIALWDHVEKDWFPRKKDWSNIDKEALWGIFNTVLKHYVVKELNIRYMNSACKDNKDRGGTLSTIDEAVRNLLLNRHNNPEALEELLYNALAPFMIKLEEILNNRNKPNEHRLGYLESVLNHIATLTGEQIKTIQENHNKLCCKIIDQTIPKGELIQPVRY